MAFVKNKFIGAGELVQDAINDAELLKAPSQNAVFDALALKINSSLIGANSGVASLDGSGKVPVSQLPNSIMEFQGAWNATTNSPSLADGTGNAGDVYRVSVAGSQDLGSGSQSYVIGDWVMYSGAIWQKSPGSDSVVSVNSQSGIVVLDADDISDAATTNKFFTEAAVLGTDLAGLSIGAGTISAASTVLQSFGYLEHRVALNDAKVSYSAATARSDLIAASISDGDTTHSPDGNSVFDALALKLDISAQLKPKKENFTLIAGDITNQYVDMAQVIKAESMIMWVDGVMQVEGEDYTISLTGGAGGKTRLTFAGGLATAGASALVATDKVHCQYMYA